jgi:hexosaminidase
MLVAITFAGILSLNTVNQMLAPQLNFVPKPVSIKFLDGTFEIARTTTIAAKNDAIVVGNIAQSELQKSTGFRFEPGMFAKKGTIAFRLDPKLASKLGTEGYILHASGNQATIRAAKPNGLFYGFQTLRQMFGTQLYGSRQTEAKLSVPAVEIEDYPRFSWRGAHMDVGRHYQPKEFILKFLDLMAMHKLNTFHWHLTEDQGWRIEIKRYPKLTKIGSKRQDTMLVYNPPKYSGIPHEGFYTQDEIREIVAYASARFITVVPEIEMPGHAQAAIAAYPELGNVDGGVEVLTKWGVSENVFNVKDSTIEFLQNVLKEVMTLFPSQFIHIGGDECPKAQWKTDAFAQAKMAKLGIKDEHALQSWFIQQMDQFLTAKGRRLIGWSEILEGGLAPGAALMVWLGNEGAMEAVSSGHDVVMAQTTHTYFDYYQAKDRSKEPHSIGGLLPLEKAYEYNPILPAMSTEQAKHVLGCQFQLWSEYIPNPSHMEYMAFPRACALAEVAWTPQEQRSFGDFKARLFEHVQRLEAMKVKYRKLD